MCDRTIAEVTKLPRDHYSAFVERLVSIESSPNVEYGKMRSEPDECALGADFRVIDSTFYFS